MSCPICRARTAPAYRPFCSRRCADVDLARWFNGSYAVPAAEEDAPDEDDYAPGEREA
ncbi:MAG: DNA gyrase inhibitor YacG [Pseudomonadota bacterium]